MLYNCSVLCISCLDDVSAADQLEFQGPDLPQQVSHDAQRRYPDELYLVNCYITLKVGNLEKGLKHNK